MSQTRNYFCYSSSLDSAAFDEWKNNHGYNSFSLPEGQKVTALGQSLSFNLFSNYWGGRVLGLEKKAGSQVEGVIFEIDSNSWPIIEHKEGLKTGLSQAVEIECQLPGGGKVVATAFSTPEARKTSQGPVSVRFLEIIQKAHKNWGLEIKFEEL